MKIISKCFIAISSEILMPIIFYNSDRNKIIHVLYIEAEPQKIMFVNIGCVTQTLTQSVVWLQS